MARVTELLIGSGGGLDAEGKAEAVRRFEVYVFDPQAAIGDPGLPPIGEAHPANPSLFLDRKQATQRDDGSFIVDCLYSSYRAFTRGTIDRKNENYYRVSFSRRSVVRLIPMALLEEKEVPTPGGGSETLDVWVPKSPLRVNEYMLRITVELTHPKLTFAQFREVARRSNKIHLIDGQKYLFTFEDPSKLTEDLDVLRYTWEIDAGTYAPDNPDTATITLPPVLAEYPPLCRQPYYSLVMVQSGDMLARPLYRNVSVYQEDLSGYVGLPGNPVR